MSNNPVRFGLIGFGAWGQHHAQSIASTPGATLAGIAAPSEASRLAAAAAHPGVPVFPDHRALLADVKPDVVDVVTPSHTHLEITRDSLAAGCDVLLEKPMAVTLEDCREIARLARTSGRRVAVGHEFRISSQWGKVKELIAEGRIGDPQYVLVELSRRPYRLGSSGWRYDPARVGSWVLEEPIHFFDLARWYLAGAGEPVELYARGNSRDPARPHLHDNFSAMFTCANGAYAVVSQTLAAFEHHQTVKVAGTKGAIWAGWSGALDRTLEPTCFLKFFDGEAVHNLPLARHSGEVFELREEISRCVAMARDGAPPPASAEDGLWSAGLCLVAEESIRQGRPLRVADWLKQTT